ncbi:MAG: hypothetical protein IJC87_06170 [Clostridia bacterium]|nr:hypothetical protein [Clostridia bacterium]
MGKKKKTTLSDSLLELRQGLKIIDNKFTCLNSNEISLNKEKTLYESKQEKRQSFHPDFLEAEMKVQTAKNNYENYINTSFRKRNKGVLKNKYERAKAIGQSPNSDLFLASFIISVIIAVIIFLILTATVDSTFIIYIITIVPTGLTALVISVPLFFTIKITIDSIYVRKTDKKHKLKLLSDVMEAENTLSEYTKPWEEVEKRFIDTKNKLLNEAKTCYNEIKLTFDNVVPEKDWALLDYVIYYIQTDKAKTIEDALNLARKQQNLESFNENLFALKTALKVEKTSLELVESKNAILELF